MNFWQAMGLEAWKPTPKPFSVEILFKSGNKIVGDKIDEIEWKTSGNTITFIRITQRESAKTKIIVGALDLSQIEAIASLS